MPINLFTCPITDCAWTHRDEGPNLLLYTDLTTEDEAHAQAELHQATVEHTLRVHYESHDVEDWVRLVAKLQGELTARGKPLLCVGCLSDRWQAAESGPAGAALPPLHPALTILEGNALCGSHLSFGAPAIPGRTPGGIILGNGAIPTTGL